MKNYHTTLSIAGSDCSGGAGIQADLKTFSALGCYGMTVITALTAQNTMGVQAIQEIPAKFIAEQLDSIFSDINVDAIKIGMLHSTEVIKTVANKLTAQITPIVLDPVMVSKNDSLLLQPSAIKSLRDNLFPLATLITPNLPEAETLLQQTINDQQTMESAAKQLSMFGPHAVLIKGGHLDNAQESADCLYIKDQNKFYWFTAERIKTKNTHGTGCTLSAAITAFLSKGHNLVAAVSAAKEYISGAISAGSEYQLGKSQGPVQHFHKGINLTKFND
jgi:hydroxymethylpyrimidine/phosphomethylpyrimidine kinase